MKNSSRIDTGLPHLARRITSKYAVYMKNIAIDENDTVSIIVFLKTFDVASGSCSRQWKATARLFEVLLTGQSVQHSQVKSCLQCNSPNPRRLVVRAALWYWTFSWRIMRQRTTSNLLVAILGTFDRSWCEQPIAASNDRHAHWSRAQNAWRKSLISYLSKKTAMKSATH